MLGALGVIFFALAAFLWSITPRDYHNPNPGDHIE